MQVLGVVVNKVALRKPSEVTVFTMAPSRQACSDPQGNKAACKFHATALSLDGNINLELVAKWHCCNPSFLVRIKGNRFGRS